MSMRIILHLKIGLSTFPITYVESITSLAFLFLFVRYIRWELLYFTESNQIQQPMTQWPRHTWKVGFTTYHLESVFLPFSNGAGKLAVTMYKKKRCNDRICKVSLYHQPKHLGRLLDVFDQMLLIHTIHVILGVTSLRHCQKWNRDLKDVCVCGVYVYALSNAAYFTCTMVVMMVAKPPSPHPRKYRTSPW